MSKRQQETEGEAAGGCCSGRKCVSHGRVPWDVLLNDATFTDRESVMSGGEAEKKTYEER